MWLFDTSVKQIFHFLYLLTANLDVFIEKIRLIIQFLAISQNTLILAGIIFSIIKKAVFLIKRYFVASMGAKVEVLAHPGDKYCEDRQAG